MGRRLTAADVLRGMLEAFNRGDYARCFDFIDPDVEWEDPVGIPGGGVHRGHEGVRAWFGRWLAAWEDFSTESEVITDAGDHAVVLERVRGRGRSSGVTVDETWVAIYEIREGRIVRRASYADEQAALDAVAASES